MVREKGHLVRIKVTFSTSIRKPEIDDLKCVNGCIMPLTHFNIF